MDKTQRAQAAAAKQELAAIETAPRPRKTLALGVIDFDPNNRAIDEGSESFRELLDSVRTFGVIYPPLVQEKEDGRYQLHDGERRIRAARAAGMTELDCQVWRQGDTKEAVLAAFAVQQHHHPHRPIEIAKRLRAMKYEQGLTVAQLADKTGIPVGRIEAYRTLLQGSEELIEFFEREEIPLKTATEMVRYCLETSPAKTRALIERFKERPLSRDEIVELRKRAKARGAQSEDAADASSTSAPRPVFARSFLAALKADRATCIAALARAVAELGLGDVFDAVRPRTEPSDSVEDKVGDKAEATGGVVPGRVQVA